MSVLGRAQRILVLSALAALVVSAGLGDASAGSPLRSAPILKAHMLAGSWVWMVLAIPAVGVGMLSDGSAAGSWARAAWTVPFLSLAAALAVLAAGAGLGTVPTGAVILFATGVTEWSVSRPAALAAPTTAGLVQVGALVLAAAALTGGIVGHDLALVEANVPLQIGGIAVFGARIGPRLLAPGWSGSGRVWLALSAVAVAASAFLGAIAAMPGQPDRWTAADRLAAAGLGTGLGGTALGIGIGSVPLTVLFATVLGLSLLASVAVAALRVSRYGMAAGLAGGG